MVSYVGENYPTSYDQVGKYVSINLTILCSYLCVSDILYQQFTQLVFPI